MGFLLANFKLPTPFRSRLLDLGSDMGETDGQTTAINALCPTLWGRWHNKRRKHSLQMLITSKIS